MEFKIRIRKLINKREFNLVLFSILIDLSFNLFMRFYFVEWCYTIFKYIFMYNVLIIKHESFFTFLSTNLLEKVLCFIIIHQIYLYDNLNSYIVLIKNTTYFVSHKN